MNLFQALRKRDRKALEALLQAAVDPDAECDDREMNDWTGKTPLVCALEWGETEIAAMLLRAGANPDRRMAWSDLPRSWSSSSSRDGIPMPHRRGKTNGPLC